MKSSFTPRQVYGRLLAYLWPNKWIFAVSLVGFAMFAASAPMLAHMMGVVEQTLRDPSDEKVALLIASLIGIYLFRGVGTFLGKYFIAWVGREVIHQLRIELFAKMLRLPSHYYDGESSGRLISRVIFDVEQVNDATTRAVTTSVQEGITVILLMGYLIWLDISLTLIFFAVVPCIGAMVALASRFFRRYSKRIQKTIGNVTQVTNDTLNAHREVRLFGAIDYEEQRFLRVSNDNRRQVMKFALTNAISVPLTQQIVALGLAAMIYLMFQRVSGGTMNAAEFLQFITAASLIAKPLRALTDINSSIQKGVAAADSIFKVMDAETEQDSGKQTLGRARGQIDFRQINFCYPETDRQVLHDINLSVNAGESIAFVGKSGSGKSTLASLLPRFYDVQCGSVELDGIAVNRLTLTDLRNQIAVVSQSVALFDASIRDNIAYGALRHCSDREIEAAAEAALVSEFSQKLPLGLDTHVGENGALLSGGQKQRIAIARALLKDAPVLILDEATSALDTESERLIQQALDHVMKNRTSIVIAHRLSTIEHVDRIVVMDDGRIIEQGSHSELLAREGAYSQLHHGQFTE